MFSEAFLSVRHDKRGKEDGICYLAKGESWVLRYLNASTDALAKKV